MLVVLAVYCLAYAAVHAAVYLRTRTAWPAWAGRKYWLAAWALAMIAAPPASIVCQHFRWENPAWILAWAGYLWMGFLLIAFCFCLDSWILECVLRLAARWRPALFTPRAAFLLALAPLALAPPVGVYGLWEARRVRVERVSIVAELPPNVERLRVLLTADLHLNLTFGPERLEKVVRLMAAQKPDIVVAAGDMVDGWIPPRYGLARILSRLKPPLGKYAVLGNHEGYAGRGYSVRFLERAGFIVLRNRSATPGGALNLAGADDSGWKAGGAGDARALASLKPGLFTILLKHRPRVSPQARGRFDLQLSGHTHGGQIFPFNWGVRLFYPMIKGLYRLKGGALLYTAPGTGFWGPPMRVLCPPEITVIDLKRARGSSSLHEE